MALTKERGPLVMNSFVLCHLEDQMLEAVKTFSAATDRISFDFHRWRITWVQTRLRSPEKVKLKDPKDNVNIIKT